MSLVPTRDEIIREARHGLVVRLRLEGLTYQEISDRVALSISQCQRVYEAARARRRGDLDMEKHLDEVFGAYVPLTQDVWGNWWKALKANREFLGLDAASQSHVKHEDLSETVNVSGG
jgi:hypothetical protein